MGQKLKCNKKGRDRQIYALFAQGNEYKAIKATFNLPVKELRDIIKTEAINHLLEKFPHVSFDEAIWLAIDFSHRNSILSKIIRSKDDA